MSVYINSGKVDRFSMVDIQAPDLGISIFKERMNSCATTNMEVKLGIEQELRNMLNGYPVKIVYLDKNGHKSSTIYHLGDLLRVAK